jgi:hypothetical protein
LCQEVIQDQEVIVHEIIHGHEVREHEVIQDFRITSHSWSQSNFESRDHSGSRGQSFMARRTFPIGRAFSVIGLLTVTLNVMYSDRRTFSLKCG